MNIHRVGVIMNGVTGRMGTNQHLMRSIVAIRNEGGIPLDDGSVLMPDPILVGRNEQKLRKLCEQSGIKKWTTNLDVALATDDYPIYFDAQVTGLRHEAVLKALDARKHIYCEKPTGSNLDEALSIYKAAVRAGVKHGVVQDKLWLPGLLKIKRLKEEGFFGRILSVRGEFGYWVFEGYTVPPNRPSWNYRKEDEGGIIVDMLCHWRYVLDHLFGKVKAVSCLGAIHIPERVDEHGLTYKVTADDAAYASFSLEGGIVAHFNSSWATRVRREDLLTLQVDGTKGSAVAGLRNCYVQSYEDTPVPIWNPDQKQPINFYEGWKEVFADEEYENAFKVQWKLFLNHVLLNSPFTNNLMEGAKGVQLAELGILSWKLRKWIDVPDLSENISDEE